MYDLECDDMMEGEWGYCAADHRDCMDNRMTCKKADVKPQMITTIKKMVNITIKDS